MRLTSVFKLRSWRCLSDTRRRCASSTVMFLVLLSCAVRWAAAQVETRLVTGQDENQEIASVKIANSGNVYISGVVKDVQELPSEFGGRDAFLGRIRSGAFSYVWFQQVGTFDDDLAHDIAITPDESNIFLLGSTSGTLVPGSSTRNSDYFISTFRPDGLKLEADVQFGGDGWDVGADALMHSSGSFIGCGRSSGAAFEGSNVGGTVFSYRLDADNIMRFEWGIQYGESSLDRNVALAEDSEGFVLVGGILVHPIAAAGHDPYVMKLDPNADGNEERVVWRYEYTRRDSTVTLNSIETDHNNNVFVLVDTWTDNFHGRELTLTKLSSKGNLLWTNKICCDAEDVGAQGVAIHFAADHKFYMSAVQTNGLVNSQNTDQVTYDSNVYVMDDFGTASNTAQINQADTRLGAFLVGDFGQDAKLFTWGTTNLFESPTRVELTTSGFDQPTFVAPTGTVFQLRWQFRMEDFQDYTQSEAVFYMQDIVQDELRLSTNDPITSISEVRDNGLTLVGETVALIVGEENVAPATNTVSLLFQSEKFSNLMGVNVVLVSNPSTEETGAGVDSPTPTPSPLPPGGVAEPDTPESSNQQIIIIAAAAGGGALLLALLILCVVCCCWNKPQPAKEGEVVHEHGYYAGDFYNDDGGYYEDGKQHCVGVEDYNYGETEVFQEGQNGYYHRPNTIGPY